MIVSPSLYTLPFYHVDLPSLDDAADLLEGHNDGTFLLMSHPSPNCHRLLYVADGYIRERAIRLERDGFYRLEGSHTTFVSLEDLVRAYKVHGGVHSHDLACRLRHPIMRSAGTLKRAGLARPSFAGRSEPAPTLGSTMARHERSHLLNGSPQSRRKSMGLSHKHYTSWNEQDVVIWLTCAGLTRHARAFYDEGITGRDLALLSEDDLCDLGVEVPAERRRVLRMIRSQFASSQEAQPRFPSRAMDTHIRRSSVTAPSSPKAQSDTRYEASAEMASRLVSERGTTAQALHNKQDLHRGMPFRQNGPSSSVSQKAVWWRPDLHRLEAHMFLRGKPEGFFLVRSSDRRPELVLTFVFDGRVYDDYILLDQGRVSLRRCPEKTFSSVRQLVAHYSFPDPNFPTELKPQLMLTATQGGTRISVAAAREIFPDEFGRIHLRPPPKRPQPGDGIYGPTFDRQLEASGRHQAVYESILPDEGENESHEHLTEDVLRAAGLLADQYLQDDEEATEASTHLLSADDRALDMTEQETDGNVMFEEAFAEEVIELDEEAPEAAQTQYSRKASRDQTEPATVAKFDSLEVLLPDSGSSLGSLRGATLVSAVENPRFEEDHQDGAQPARRSSRDSRAAGSNNAKGKNRDSATYDAVDPDVKAVDLARPPRSGRTSFVENDSAAPRPPPRHHKKSNRRQQNTPGEGHEEKSTPKPPTGATVPDDTPRSVFRLMSESSSGGPRAGNVDRTASVDSYIDRFSYDDSRSRHGSRPTRQRSKRPSIMTMLGDGRSAWFVPDMTPDAALLILQSGASGDFLVHNDGKGGLALSYVVADDDVDTTPIEQRRGDKCLKGSKETFGSVTDLVQFYSTDDQHELPVKLADVV